MSFPSRPTREEIIKLSMHDPTVASAMNEYVYFRLTFEEALILMVKTFHAQNKILREQVIKLNVLHPAGIPIYDLSKIEDAVEVSDEDT